VVPSAKQAAIALNDSAQNVNKLLYRLTRKRWLLRLEKGKYLITAKSRTKRPKQKTPLDRQGSSGVDNFKLRYGQRLTSPLNGDTRKQHCIACRSGRKTERPSTGKQ